MTSCRSSVYHFQHTATAELQSKYAALLQVQPLEIYDIKLYSKIDAWVGTPYLAGGNTQSGTDCSGFTQCIYRDAYNRKIFRTALAQAGEINPEALAALHEGDLVFFRSKGVYGPIDHVGIYLTNGRFVHASTSKGVVISDINQTYYQERFVEGGPVIRLAF